MDTSQLTPWPGDAMATQRITRVEWSRDEWFRLLVQTMPKAPAGGQLLGKAIEKVQKKLLPRERHREYKRIYGSLQVDVIKGYMDELKAMTAEQRAQYGSPETGQLQDDDLRRTRIRWTTRELALLAREVDRMRADGDLRALSSLVITAQALVLPPERRRGA